MPAHYIRLEPGDYTCERPVTLVLRRDGVAIETRAAQPGVVFGIPATVNRFAWFVVYYPDFGDKEPILTRQPD